MSEDTGKIIGKLMRDELDERERQRLLRDKRVEERMRSQWETEEMIPDPIREERIWRRIRLAIDGRTTRRVWLYKAVAVAASLLLLVGTGAVVYWASHQEARYMYVMASGIRSIESVSLPDGTRVRLGANSKLTYPDRFNGERRDVRLEGQAFFDVAKDPDRRFVVHADTVAVAVYGTAFNVAAYADEPSIETTLLRGSVEVTSGRRKVMLEPGQQARVGRSGAIFDVRQVPAEEYAAWTRGVFAFQEEPLSSICRKLSRWYDVEILPSGFDADSLVRSAVDVAKEADVVLFFGGLNKNFRQDCEGDDRESMDLPYGQNELLDKILQVNPNVGVVVISGNAVSMAWLEEVKGLMQSWYLGSEAGTATARVISGEVSPSGKLPFSIPRKLEDNSAHYFGSKSYPGDGKNVYYCDDILVGYRWHDTRRIDPLFPFGYGLSYTGFEYGKASADKKNYTAADTVKIQVEIANVGRMDGAETMQVYVSQENPSLPRPVKELKGFQKVFLREGEKKYVTLEIPVRDFAFYDDRQSRWVVEPDRYKLHIAASSRDIKKSVEVVVKP